MGEVRLNMAPGNRIRLLIELGSQEGIYFRRENGHVKMEKKKWAQRVKGQGPEIGSARGHVYPGHELL